MRRDRVIFKSLCNTALLRQIYKTNKLANRIIPTVSILILITLVSSIVPSPVIAQSEQLRIITGSSYSNGVLKIDIAGEPSNTTIIVTNLRPYWVNLRISTVGMNQPTPKGPADEFFHSTLGAIPPSESISYVGAFECRGAEATFFAGLAPDIAREPELGYNTLVMNFIHVIFDLLSALAPSNPTDISEIINMVNEISDLFGILENVSAAISPDASWWDRAIAMGRLCKNVFDFVNNYDNRMALASKLADMEWFKEHAISTPAIADQLHNLAGVGALAKAYQRWMSMFFDELYCVSFGYVTVKAIADVDVVNPTLSISPQSALPGTLFQAEGRGFTSNGSVLFRLASPDNIEQIIETTHSDSGGAVAITFDSSDFNPGNYLFWAIDVQSDKQSNQVSFSLSSPSGMPDLTVTAVSAPTSATIGGTISVGFAVKNLGDAPPVSFQNLVSLGTSSWGTQIHLGYFDMDSIGPGLYLSDTVQITIPSAVSPGIYWVTVYANPGEVGESDPYNNINKAPMQIQILASSEADITRPEVSLSGPSNGEVYISGTQKTIIWSAKDNIGIESVDFYFTTDGWQTSQKLCSASPDISSYAWTVPLVNTTQAQFMVIAWDATSNAGIDLGGIFTITSEPDLLPAPVMNEPQISGRNYEISWSNIEGVSSYILQEGNDFSFSNPMAYQVMQTYRYFSNRELGAYYYRVAAVNEYGRGEWSSFKSVTLQADLGPGEISLISPVDGAPEQPLTVTLQWSASHPGGESLTYDVYLMPFYSDTLYSAHIVSSSQVQSSYIATNLEYNKPYSWGVRAWDETGNNRTSAIYHFTTIADDNPPTGSITINDGEATTDTYAVTLCLSASDTGSGVQYMRFSNDDQNWTNWNWFTSRYPWNIADTQYGGKYNQTIYTVYTQFRDAQGNESPVYSDTITKITAAPGNIILNGVYYETIRDAVAAAQSGDTIYLTDGTYTIWGETNSPRYPSTSVGIVLKPGVNLKGVGADRTKIVAESGLKTVIDADNSVIEGLTIVMADPYGVRQAVLMESDSSEVRNCIIWSTYDGIEIWGNNNLVANNLIKDSETAVNISQGTNSRIYNNTIVNNAGNGIVSQDSDAEVKNNIIAYNNNYGIYVHPDTDFRNNDVFGNFRNYADDWWLGDQTGINGNIEADPLLNSEYRLNSGSLAINAGIDVGIPFNSSAPDMGAFEYGASGTLQVMSNHDQTSFTISGPQDYVGTGREWIISGAPIGVYSITFEPIFEHYSPYYQVVTLMSNRAVIFDGTYQPDNVPPSGSISVNFNEYATGDDMVTIALSFIDAIAGLGDGAQMMFSNDGSTWSPAEPLSTVKNDWDLTAYDGNPDSGLKNVYAKVSDVLGNWTTEPITDTILYVPNRQILEVPTDYATIQSAIDVAQDGDVVQVLPGEYQEEATLKEGVRLQGSGPEVTSLSTTGTAITVANNSMVDGFTINKSPWMGYIGILCDDTSAIISNNIIRASRGIQIRGNSTSIVRNNIITECTQAILVGGVESAVMDVLIENNTIASNNEGIYLTSATPNKTLHVINNIVADNDGCGITDTNTSDTAHKHIFSTFNLFWQNAGGNFGGYNKDKISGAGDMETDPLFEQRSVPVGNIFEDNFESYSEGNLNGQGGWSGDTNFKIQGDTIWEGTGAIECALVSSVMIDKIGTLSTGFSQGIFMMATTANGEFRTSFRNSIVTPFTLKLNTNSRVTLETPDQIAELGPYQANKWYYIECQYTHPVAYIDRMRARYRNVSDGTSFSSWTDWIESPVGTELGLDRIRLSTNSNASGYAYWDNVVEGETTDPVLVNDYTGLQSGSPAINSGCPEARYNDTNDTRNDRGVWGGPCHNTPPKADFIVNPESGSPGTEFNFDADISHDLESPNGKLSVRWDFDGDGTYESYFQTTKQQTHQYDLPGDYNVTLQVRDAGGFTLTASRIIKVTNQSPNTPSEPLPANESTEQPTRLTLSWIGGDPDPGDNVTYDVYFGLGTNPPLVSSSQTETTYEPEMLQHFKFYFWKILATDSNGVSVSDPIWSFLTESEPLPEPPSSLIATAASATQIDLEWIDNSNNELGFRIERKAETEVTYSIIDIMPADTTSFSDSNLAGGMTYYYRVCAYNNTGNSGYSNEASTVPTVGGTIVLVDKLELVMPWIIVAALIVVAGIWFGIWNGRRKIGSPSGR